MFFLFWMLTFLAVFLMVYTFRKFLMVYTFRNILGLLESGIMLQTSTRDINIERQNLSSSAIGIINFEKTFVLNFIVDTMN